MHRKHFAIMALKGLLLAAAMLAAPAAVAGEFAVALGERPDLKAVFGRVESRDQVAARARLGGTIVSLKVEEGSAVAAGDVVALVVDDKLALKLGAVDAQIRALDAELANAAIELERAKKLLASGVVPKNRVDTLQTQVDVLTNQIVAARAERSVLEQQRSEGEVLAPAPGRVLAVPVTEGSVVLPGETVARIAGGGYFLRLSLPERHAAHIRTGDAVLVGGRGLGEIGGPETTRTGHVVKVYPEIDGGRVLADVEVEGLGDFFVGERTRVWIAVAKRPVIAVPRQALATRAGVDYVRLARGGAQLDVAVVAGASFHEGSAEMIEILSGLVPGDRVVLP
jgi:RND family efflux transporter MFP subunit